MYQLCSTAAIAYVSFIVGIKLVPCLHKSSILFQYQKQFFPLFNSSWNIPKEEQENWYLGPQADIITNILSCQYELFEHILL